MNNNVYRELQIPNLFIPYYKDMVFNSSVEMRLLLSQINADFINWLTTLNIGVRNCRFFSAEPSDKYVLHKDIDWNNEKNKTFNDCVKLNIIYNASNSKMIWYEERPGLVPNIIRNAVGEELRTYNKENCSVVFESLVIGPSCLVNGMVIHTMINGNTTRHCYSLPLIDLTTSNRLTWDDAVNRLSKYINQ